MLSFGSAKKKKLVRRIMLHIGHDKCGSKSLQRFIEVNAPQLAQESMGSVHCTKVGRYDLGLRAYAGDPDIVRVYRERHGLGPGSIDETRKYLEETIEDELAQSDFLTLLLSFEGLLHMKKSEIAKLATLLKNLADKVDIFAVVRRQDRHAMSGYTTRLRNIAFTNPSLFFNENYKPVGLHYFRCLENWSAVFGRPNIHTVAYEDHDNIVEAYASALSLDLSLFQLPARENTSLSAFGQEVLRQFNLQAGNNPGWKPVAQDIRVKLRAILPAGASRLPTRSEAEAFLKPYKSDNAKLKSKYLPANTRFDEDLVTYPDTPQDIRVSQEELEYWVKKATEKAGL